MLYLVHNSFERLSPLCSGGFFVYIQKILLVFAEFPAESLRIFCAKQHPLQKIPQRAFKSLLVLMSFNHPDAGGFASLIAKSERSVFRCNGLLVFDAFSNRLRVIQKLPWIRAAVSSKSSHCALLLSCVLDAQHSRPQRAFLRRV